MWKLVKPTVLSVISYEDFIFLVDEKDNCIVFCLSNVCMAENCLTVFFQLIR